MRETKVCIGVVALLSLFGFATALYATAWGVGVVSDSLVYIDAARHLLNGQGLACISPGDARETPLTHYPPLYPAVLAAIGAAGIDLWTAARWLNAFLFGANIFLIGVLISRYSRGAAWAAPFGSLLMLASATMLRQHTTAMTEPFFIFLALLGFYLLARYVESSKPVFIFAAALVCGLALTTRYAGAALILTGATALLALGSKKFPQKIADSAVFVAVSSLPAVFWIARNAAIAGMAATRPVAVHGLNIGHLKQVLVVFAGWLVPGDASNYLKLAFAAIFVLSILLCLRGSAVQGGGTFTGRIRRAPYMLKLLSIFAIIYIAFVVLTKMFFDATTPFDDRILLTVYIAGVIVACCLLGWLLPSAGAALRIRAVPLLFCLLLLTGASVFRGAVLAVQGHDYGIGFASREWTQSGTINELKSISPSLFIYSNEPNAVTYQTGRIAAWLPNKYNTLSRQPNGDYDYEMNAMRGRLLARKCVIVYFKGYDHTFLPNEKELAALTPLRVLAGAADGTIYDGSDTSVK